MFGVMLLMCVRNFSIDWLKVVGWVVLRLWDVFWMCCSLVCGRVVVSVLVVVGNGSGLCLLLRIRFGRLIECSFDSVSVGGWLVICLIRVMVLFSVIWWNVVDECFYILVLFIVLMNSFSFCFVLLLWINLSVWCWNWLCFNGFLGVGRLVWVQILVVQLLLGLVRFSECRVFGVVSVRCNVRLLLWEWLSRCIGLLSCLISVSRLVMWWVLVKFVFCLFQCLGQQ